MLLTILLFLSAPAHATTKGLSQIVTPDLQKPADLSLSAQLQNSVIGNPYQAQLELGLTPWFEGAVFRGFDPGEFLFAAEAGLIQREPYLLSVGFLNLSSRGGKMQPFLEGGYYLEHNKWMLGVIAAHSEAEVVLGWAYDFDSHWRAQIDFQGGRDNFSTIGFTHTLSERFQWNPALYVSNAPDHALSGYVVFTYTFAAWSHAAAPAPGAGESL